MSEVGCDSDAPISTIKTNDGSTVAGKRPQNVEGVAVEDLEQKGATGQLTVARQSSEETAFVDMNSIAAMLKKCLRFHSDVADRWDKQVKAGKRWWQMQVQVNNQTLFGDAAER